MSEKQEKSLQPTWWELVGRLHRRIDREATITPALRAAIVELRDLLDEWLGEIDER